MKIFIFTLLLLFSCNILISQELPDSLKEKLSNKTPKEQAAYLNKIANNKLKASPVTAFQLAKTSFQIAQNNNDLNNMASAGLLAGKAARYSKQASQGIPFISKAVELIAKSTQKNLLAQAYVELGLCYTENAQYSDAIDAFNKSIDIFNQLNDVKSAYNATFNLGTVYIKSNKVKEAISIFTKAKSIAESLNDKNEITNSTYQLAIAYAKYGNTNEALKYFNEARQLATNLNLTSLVNTIDNNIKTLESNLANKQKTVYEQEKEQEQQKLLSELQSEYQLAQLEKIKSFEEIEKLSLENREKEYKLRAIQGEIEKQRLENQLKEQNLKLLEAEKKKKEAEIAKQNEILAYQQRMIYTISIALVIVIVLLILVVRLYIINKKTLNLIRKQKTQIEQQKQEIELINKELAHQNTIIRESIDYAKHIQFALLPNISIIEAQLKNFFLFFKPRDVVSGDFYWFHKVNDSSILATIDCTGHGVPGAFMTLISNALLNKIVKEKQIYDPALILEELNKEVLHTMSQSGDELDNSMDITICSYNHQNDIIEIAMAGHSCVIINNNELTELDGKDFIIGGVFASPDNKYEKHQIKAQTGMSFYFFSDGFADQIGGTDKKKLGQKSFNEILLSINSLPPKEKVDSLNKSFNEWKGNHKQVDDVIVVGFNC